MSIDQWRLSKTERYMYDRGQRDARIAAFGAIRRAAEVARKAERDYALFYSEAQGSLDDFGPGVQTVFADGCRAAIRAAIGSPKA